MEYSKTNPRFPRSKVGRTNPSKVDVAGSGEVGREEEEEEEEDEDEGEGEGEGESLHV